MTDLTNIDLKKAKSLNGPKLMTAEDLVLPNAKEKAEITFVAYQDKQQDKKSERANKINSDLDKMSLNILGTDKDPVKNEISKILGVETKASTKNIKDRMDDLHSEVQNSDVSDPRFLGSFKGFQDQQTNRAAVPINIEQAKAVFELAKSLSDPEGDYRKTVDASAPAKQREIIIKSAVKEAYKKVFDLIEGNKAFPLAPPAAQGY